MVKRQNTAQATRIGLLTWSTMLIGGSALSGLALVFARRHGYEDAVLWLGFLTVTLWFAGLVCLGLKVLQLTERRKRRPVAPMRVATDAEYVAQYSARDRAIGLGLMVFFAGLLVYLVSRSGRAIGIVISGGFFCFFAWYTLQMMVTRVKFTRERIVARLPVFREVSERYADVVQLRSKPGTVRVDFADGQALKLHSGLGDPDVIIAYLDAHCPPSVVSGGHRGS